MNDERGHTATGISRSYFVMKRARRVCTKICLIVLFMIAFTACSGTVTGVSNTVHMGATNFEQPSITIKKGETITLVNDSASIHIIENGTWDHGSNGRVYQAKSYQEQGAPKVDTQITGNNNRTIGPFNTAGTFHLYCVVHPGMNLTVIVR